MKPIFLDPPFDSVCFYGFFCFGDFLGNGDPFGDRNIVFPAVMAATLLSTANMMRIISLQ